MTRAAGRTAVRRWGPVEILAAGWALVTVSPRLHETLLANVQWLALAALVAGVALLRNPAGRGAPRGLWPAAGLAAAALAAGWSGVAPLEAAIHAVKILLVWLVAYPLLYRRPAVALAALDGVLAAVWVNAALVALGAAGVEWAAAPSGAGRWGTLLVAEGSLAPLGVVAFAYVIARVLTEETVSPLSAAQAAAGIGLALLDGSRAALAGFPLVFAALVAALAADSDFRAATARRLSRLALAVAALWLVWQALPRYDHPGIRSGVAGAERVARLVEAADGASFSEFVERLDPARYRAIARSLQVIERRPLLGGGLGSTRVEGLNSEVTVHNAYLQAWADLGLAGALSYWALTLGWLAATPRFLARARQARADRKALCYGSLAALAYYNWSDLFQGVSVDASRWIFFVLPAVFYWRLLAAAPRTARAPARPAPGPGLAPAVVAGGRP